MNYEKLPKTISAEELLSTPLPPVKWIIPDLLPAGLALFAGPSKAGKSWLTLWLCLQVAQGKPMWGREIEPHTVLYLSLEDTFNRLQKRLLQLVGSEEAPERLVMQTECSSIGQGLEEQLTSFLYQHPDTGLIVIDTLQKVRSSDQNNSMYASDYKEISALKALADKYNICILLIHHLRKQAADDPFQQIAGSNAVIHIAIVEDVKAEADLLQGCLEQYRQDNHIVFQLHFFPDADTFLQTDTHTFDIVFMDVDMPGRNGIEASRVLRETNKTIVLLFVTNLAQYAIAGYEVDALDYILKPINYYSFKLKIQKALEAVHHLHGIMLTISGEHGPQYVRSTDVLYIEVQNHSLIYHTQYSDLTATGTLKRVENQLAEEGFFRCNYCYLVNLRHVDFLDGNTVMVGGHPLQISRNRRKDFLQQMTGFYGKGGR